MRKSPICYSDRKMLVRAPKLFSICFCCVFGKTAKWANIKKLMKIHKSLSMLAQWNKKLSKNTHNATDNKTGHVLHMIWIESCFFRMNVTSIFVHVKCSLKKPSFLSSQKKNMWNRIYFWVNEKLSKLLKFSFQLASQKQSLFRRR